MLSSSKTNEEYSINKNCSYIVCNDCLQLYKIHTLDINLENTIVCKNCNKYDFFIDDDIVISYINEYPEIWFFYNKDYNKFKFLLYKSQFYYNEKRECGAMCIFLENNFLLTFPINNFI